MSIVNEKVKRTIKQNNMIVDVSNILVGLSGGADSVALLHFLKENFQDIKISAAHLNHSIRGDEAEEDRLFVENLCWQWNVDCYTEKADVPSYAMKYNMSEEEAGRVLRYRFFNRILDKIGGGVIALGHHKNDQAETILHHIIRGTGLKGLRGILPIRDNIIRPFIDIDRSEIEDYCKYNNLKFRVDSTNINTEYTRNKIRHEVLPMLSQLNPNIVEALVKLGTLTQIEEEYLTSCVDKYYCDIVTHKEGMVYFNINDFRKLHKAIKMRIIKKAVSCIRSNYNSFEYKHIDSVIGLIGKKTGSKVDLPEDIEAKVEYDNLVINRKQKTINKFSYRLEITGETEIKELKAKIIAEQCKKDIINVKLPYTLYVDYDKIQGDLFVRNRKEGDRIISLGMKGSKKVKDILIDSKVPRNRRNKIPIITDDKNIIWLVGHRSSELYKITAATKRVLKLTFVQET